MASLADQFLDDLSSASGDDAAPNEGSAPAPVPSSSAASRAPAGSARFAPSGGEGALATTAAGLEVLVARVQDGADGGDEQALLRDCVRAVGDARAAATAGHLRVRELYSVRFPELASLMPEASEYEKVVRVLGNEIAGGGEGLSAAIGAAGVITVQLAASTSSGRRFSEAELAMLKAVLDEVDGSEAAEQTLLEYVEKRAGVIAPNLVRVVGGKVAAQLLGEAGGLDALAVMPSCNVKGLGRVKRELMGGSSARRGRHDGLVHTSPRVLALPEKMRSKGGDYVANKVVLAARVDYAGERLDGSMGASLGDEITDRFEKWQELAPARTAKPLPVPGEFKKKHRAGKRARRQKELYGMSEMRKQANRVNFNEAEAQYGNDMESGGLGLLGGPGGAGGSGAGASGRLRVAAKKTNSLALAASRRMAKGGRRAPSAAIAAGLTTTVQGIELGTMTPAPGGVGLGRMDAADGTKSVYFAPTTGFVAGRPPAGGNGTGGK